MKKGILSVCIAVLLVVIVFSGCQEIDYFSNEYDVLPDSIINLNYPFYEGDIRITGNSAENKLSLIGSKRYAPLSTPPTIDVNIVGKNVDINIPYKDNCDVLFSILLPNSFEEFNIFLSYLREILIEDASGNITTNSIVHLKDFSGNLTANSIYGEFKQNPHHHSSVIADDYIRFYFNPMLNIDIEAKSINGSISFDKDLFSFYNLSENNFTGRIGKGGKKVYMEAQNDNISLSYGNYETPENVFNESRLIYTNYKRDYTIQLKPNWSFDNRVHTLVINKEGLNQGNSSKIHVSHPEIEAANLTFKEKINSAYSVDYQNFENYSLIFSNFTTFNGIESYERIYSYNEPGKEKKAKKIIFESYRNIFYRIEFISDMSLYDEYIDEANEIMYSLNLL